MANKYANLIGTNLIKDEYTKINTGFDAVETDINTVKTDIANHETAADPHDQYALDTDLATLQTEVTAHKAESVQQAGGVHGLKVEEGTWTPYYSPETGAFGNLPYVATTGVYKRVGNIVHVRFLIAIDTRSDSDFNLGTASGNLSIGGLPFASNSSFALSLLTAFKLKDVADTLLLGVSQDKIDLRLYGPTETVSTSRLKVSNMSTDNTNATNQISGTGFYFID